MMPLKDLHRQACKFGRWGMSAKGSVPAFFIIPDPIEPDRVNLISTPWGDADEKYAMVDMVRRYIRECHVDAYAFVTEAWLASVDMRTQPELAKVPPSERSQREDVLLIMSRTRDGETCSTKYPVHYHAEGMPTLGEPEDLTPEIQTGYLANMFEEPR